MLGKAKLLFLSVHHLCSNSLLLSIISIFMVCITLVNIIDANITNVYSDLILVQVIFL